MTTPSNAEIQAQMRAERVKLPPKPRGGFRPGGGGVRKVPIDAVGCHLDLDPAELIRLDSARAMTLPTKTSRRQFVRDALSAQIDTGWVDIPQAVEPGTRAKRHQVPLRVPRGVYAEVKAAAERNQTTIQEVMRAAVRVAVDEVFLGDRRAVRKKLREDAANRSKA